MRSDPYRHESLVIGFTVLLGLLVMLLLVLDR